MLFKSSVLTCVRINVYPQKTPISPQKSPIMHLGEEWWNVCKCVCMFFMYCVYVYVYVGNFFGSEKLVKWKRAPYLRKRDPLWTLMRSQTRLFQIWCIYVETHDLWFQKSLVCRSLCKGKETHVSVLMLACMLSTARFLSKRHAHVDEDCEHTTCMLRSNCYEHGPFFYVCTTASTPSASEDCVSVYMGHVSIYNELCFYIRGIHMNSCLYIHESCLFTHTTESTPSTR